MRIGDGLAEDAVRRAGRVDVLIANLAAPAPMTRARGERRLSLASDEVSFFAGQSFPFFGGWVT